MKSQFGSPHSSIDTATRAVVRMFAHEMNTVRWETRIASGRGLELSVLGPGALRRSYSFADAPSLIDYQVQFEQQLLADGYGVIAQGERRTGYDRRRHQRTTRDRRRQ